jgi:hypothetical protein
MAKRISLAILWGLATWTWVSIAHTFIGTPDVSALAALIAATAILMRGWAWTRAGGQHSQPGRGYASQRS